MKNFKIFILLLFITLICSCSSIRSIHKLGEQPSIVNAKEWEGTWISDEGAVMVKVIDPDSNEIEIMLIENDKIERHHVFINQSGNNTYGNLVTPEKYFIFVKFKMRKNEILIWLPEFEMIKAAIDSKKLAGVVKDRDILIQSDEKVFNAYFIDNEDQILFEYEEPLIFRKLVR